MGKTDTFASLLPNVLDLAYLSGNVYDMPNKPKTEEQATEYITPAEASKIVYISTKQLTRYADEGRIAFIRPGKHRRYLKSDVVALLSPAAEAVSS